MWYHSGTIDVPITDLLDACIPACVIYASYAVTRRSSCIGMAVIHRCTWTTYERPEQLPMAARSSKKPRDARMTKIQFGLLVPSDALDKSRHHSYMDDVNRLLNTVKGSYHSAWFIDYL
jgi:hypothetical protein